MGLTLTLSHHARSCITTARRRCRSSPLSPPPLCLLLLPMSSAAYLATETYPRSRGQGLEASRADSSSTHARLTLSPLLPPYISSTPPLIPSSPSLPIPFHSTRLLLLRPQPPSTQQQQQNAGWWRRSLSSSSSQGSHCSRRGRARPSFLRRQLRAFLALCARHLGPRARDGDAYRG